jgi:hypothetical protein
MDNMAVEIVGNEVPPSFSIRLGTVFLSTIK